MGFRHGGDLSARRQHRRRRLHADPSRRGERDIAIDYRETAPAATTRGHVSQRGGQRRPARSRAIGASPSACPERSPGWRWPCSNTAPAGSSWAELIAPAIELARDGFRSARSSRIGRRSADARMARWPSSAKVFLNPDGMRCRARRGCSCRPTSPARWTHRRARGRAPSTKARSPTRLPPRSATAGGKMTSDDLKKYRAVERAGAARQLSRLRDRSMPPAVVGRRAPDRDAQRAGGLPISTRRRPGVGLHLMVEAMQLRLCRSRRICSAIPDFVKAPIGGLMSKRYAAAAPRIEPQARHAIGQITPASRRRFEGNNTTHFSVVDRFGNAVGQHLHAQARLRRRPGRRGHRRAAQQRARRFRRRARRAQCLRPDRLRRQRARARTSGRCPR